jgi:hypothetical protein
MLALFAAGLMLAAKTGSVPSQAPSASVRPDSTQKPQVDGTIEFSLKSCGRSAQDLYGEIVKIVVANSDGTSVDTPTWSFGGKTSLRAPLNVPAGVYSYRARNNVGCVTSGSVAVLPGSVREVDKMLHPYVTISLLPRLHLYGTAPPGTSISVVRYSARLDCNSAIANAQAQNFQELDRDIVGYYAEDYALGNGAVFGIRVQPTKGVDRTIRVAADDLRKLGTPASIRFDITTQILRAAIKQPADVLICVSP